MPALSTLALHLVSSACCMYILGTTKVCVGS